MRNVALITGASRGIGLAFAKLLAELKYNLLLVARDQSRLINLQEYFRSNYDIQVEIFSLDLSLPDSPGKLIDFVQKRNIETEIVINNAAMGYCGESLQMAEKQEMQMIQLNIISLVYLTKYFLKEMAIRNSGSIINVSSTAAFFPGPYRAAYYASKAYLLSYTESLAQEIMSSNVRLMVLCPGAVRTDFHRQSGMQISEKDLQKMPTAEQVTRYAWRALQKRKVIAVYGWRNKVLIAFSKFLPRGMLRKVLTYLGKKKVKSAGTG